MTRASGGPPRRQLLTRALTHGLRQALKMLEEFFEEQGTLLRKSYVGVFRGFVTFLEAISKLKGLHNPKPTPAKAPPHPLETPARLPVPSLRVRDG